MVSKWRNSKDFSSKLVFILGISIIVIVSQVYRVAAADPGNPDFTRTWERPDRPVASGQVNRTWLWGPSAFTTTLSETYQDAPNSSRTVQYFDKSRMEITHPSSNRSNDWFVTNGLLVIELMTGNLQLGDSTFKQFDPATVNIAGDADDPTGPTYATLALVRDQSPLSDGEQIIQRLDRSGKVITDPALSHYEVTTAERVTLPGIDHQVASPFWSFMNSRGLVYLDGEYRTDNLFSNPFYATGLPVTEAYWATVKVGGEYKDVLVQAFERRVLTYAPGNSAGWQVEAGNVGQHYYQWRYQQIPDDGQTKPGDPPDAPAPIPTEPGEPPAKPQPTEPAPDPTQPPAPTPTPAEPDPVPDRPQPSGNPVTNYFWSNSWGGGINPRSVLESPSGISITETGNIAIVDVEKQFIQQFKPNGERIVGLLESDPDSAPSDMHVDKDGNIWVLLTNDGVLKGYAANGIRFITIGGPGTGNGQFRLPFRFDIGPDGYFYIADSNNHRVQVMSKTGGFIRAFGSRGAGSGQFDFPSGIAVGADGTVYVADQNNHRIQVFTSTGIWLRTLSGSGTGPGQLNTPTGVDVDASGNVYVAEFGNRRVQQLDGQTGAYKNMYIGTTTGGNVLQSPVDVAVDQGFVYVSDRDKKAIFKFANDARLLDRWNDDSRSRFANRENSLRSIDVSPAGDIYVLDRFLERVVQFDRNGGYIDELATGSDEIFGIELSNTGDLYFINIGGILTIVHPDGGTNQISNMPIDVYGFAVDDQGLMYIPELDLGPVSTSQINVYNPQGEFLYSFGEFGSGPGQFGLVADVEIWGDFLFVSDNDNNEIDVFDRNGNYFYSWGENGNGPGQFNGQFGIDIDKHGFVYVADTGNDRIQTFTPGGELITVFGESGSGQGQFKNPFDIVAGANGLLYIADADNIRIQVLAALGTI